MTIKCPQCGHQNADDIEFCEQCGAQLPAPVAAGSAGPVLVGAVASSAPVAPAGNEPQLVCSNCKAPLTVGDEFCFNCGTDVRSITGVQPLVAPQPTAPVQAPPDNASPAQPPAVNDAALNQALAELEGKAAAEPATSNAFSAPPPVFSPAPPAATPEVQPTALELHISGPYGPEVVEWKGQELLLGRNDPKTRVFPNVNLDDSAASRRHLAIWKEDSDGLFYAQDLESANGTVLNGRDLKPGEPNELHDADVLKIGTRYIIQLKIS
jgi:hypothetical protein